MSRVRHRLIDDHRPYVELLDRPAILREIDDMAFRRTRIHLKNLREWFTSRTGWPVVKNRDLIRLVRTPANLDGGLGLQDLRSPLDYEILTWVLWYHEYTMGINFVVSQLAPEIQIQARSQEYSTAIDWDRYEHRQALRRAMKALEQLGAVICINGDIDKWAADMNSGNALYEFTPLARHLLVNLPEDLYIQVAIAGQPDALEGCIESVPPEQRLYRALLLSPGLHAHQDPKAFALLHPRDRRQRIADDVAGHLGWELEVSDSYACLLRPSASEAGQQWLFPSRSATSHVVLLFCGLIRDRVQEGFEDPASERGLKSDPWDRIPLSGAAIESLLSQIVDRHRSSLGTTYGKKNIKHITTDVIETMSAWHFLTGPDADGQYYVMPLAARMCGSYKEGAPAVQVEEETNP